MGKSKYLNRGGRVGWHSTKTINVSEAVYNKSQKSYCWGGEDDDFLATAVNGSIREEVHKIKAVYLAALHALRPSSDGHVACLADLVSKDVVNTKVVLDSVT